MSVQHIQQIPSEMAEAKKKKDKDKSKHEEPMEIGLYCLTNQNWPIQVYEFGRFYANL